MTPGCGTNSPALQSSVCVTVHELSRCAPLNGESDATDRFKKPIRVIDMCKTFICKRGIHFSAPLDWNFHVLSHTWSGSVRALSQRIGQSIQSAADQDPDAYNRAFQEEDFSEDLCYKQLLELFELLMRDGVERIWFDALCINQFVDEEKSLEITHMGPYYSLSKGCYVLTHGVGEGYELWSKESPSDRGSVLPRWFTRVWTFQEFLLPRRLCFIVEGVDERFVAVVNHLIREKSRIGLCRCFLKMQADIDQILESSLACEDLKSMGGFELRDQNWKSIMELIKERVDSYRWWRIGAVHKRELIDCCNGDYNAKTDKLHRRNLVKKESGMENISKIWATTPSEPQKIITSSDEECEQCRFKPMIRVAKASTAPRSPTYFVDREAYLALMQCDSRMVEGKAEVHQQPTSGVQALRGLYCALATEGNWRPCHVICEVGLRNCSVEEDRVLSILGLLGLHLHQLRTGKSLKDQVMELAKAGGSDILLELCMMNQKGGKEVGISWAPDFHGANKKLECALRPVQVDMEVIRPLGDDGRLWLKAKVAWGKVVPSTDKQDIDQSTGEASHCLIVPHDHLQAPASATLEGTRIPLDVLQQKEMPSFQQSILHFDFSSAYHSARLGSFEVPIKSNADRVSFPVRLVLLGKDERGSKLILICIAEGTSSKSELHKIGSIALPDNMAMELHTTFEGCKMQECVIGGFGADLSDYVHVH